LHAGRYKVGSFARRELVIATLADAKLMHLHCPLRLASKRA
jgi:hypothetical protein